MYIKQNGKWSISGGIDNSKIDLSQPHIIGLYNDKPVYEVTIETKTASKEKVNERCCIINDKVPLGSIILFFNSIIQLSNGTVINGNIPAYKTAVSTENDWSMYAIGQNNSNVTIWGYHGNSFYNSCPLYATIRFIKPE